MNEKWQKRMVCTLLDLTRKAYLRHEMLDHHLSTHFDIDYDVFAPDPLFNYATDLLGETIRDHRLLLWWLTHAPDEPIYTKEGEKDGQRIVTAVQLWKYYQANRGREG